MEYQAIVNKCTDAFAKGNIELASEYWCKLYDKLEREEAKLDKDDYEGKHLLFRKFAVYMRQFTDKEVYTITDYLKEKYYKKI